MPFPAISDGEESDADIVPTSDDAELAFGIATSEMFMIQNRSVFIDAPIGGVESM